MTAETIGPNIAVVGAGPAGLTLARILQVHGIDVAVYERERSRRHRPQGGSLDLHPDTGQRALHLAGLSAAYRAAARPEAQEMRLLGKDGTVFRRETVADAAQYEPEIDRGVLRDILLDSLAPGTVRWDHELRQAEPYGSGRHLLHFADGTTTPCDVLIAADGGWSRIRRLVTDAEPVYTGVTFIEVGVPNADRTHPELARLVGGGSLYACEDGKALMAQRNGDGRIRTYVGLRVPEDWLETSGIPFDRPSAAREALLARFTDWAPHLTDLVRYCDDDLVPRPLMMLPVGLRWAHRPGVTLVGDAAHLMSPFAGEGANIALDDAAVLGSALADVEHTATALDSAMEAYERMMFERAAPRAAESAANLDILFGANGSQAMSELMRAKDAAS